MLELSVNKFRANLKGFVDKVIEEHQAIRKLIKFGDINSELWTDV